MLNVNKRCIPTLKPDHVSLGKCAACHQFIRHFSSVNHDDVTELLRSGFHYNGFKKVLTGSPEEEGFAHMHHVLLLSSLDKTEHKELCVQRINECRVLLTHLKRENFVVSDNNSAVILICNSENDIEAFYFGRHEHCYSKLTHLPEDDFDLTLTRNVLYLKFQKLMLSVQFNQNSANVRKIPLTEDIEVLSISNTMLVTRNCLDDKGTLLCDHFDEEQTRELILSEEVGVNLLESHISIFSIARKVIWLACSDEIIDVYSFSKTRGLLLLDTISIRSCVSDSDFDDFYFINIGLSCCLTQAFLLYVRKQNGEVCGDKSSFVLVLDLKKLIVVSVLEMELTMNREPQLKMYPSRDGRKLFVQERFENRVVFYQVFSLTSNFSLRNIVKHFIWESLDKENILKCNLPRPLEDEVVEGF